MQIDPSKIGPVFAVGGENLIRKYDEGYLLKSPIGIRIRLGKEKYVKEVVEDFPILKKYFKDFLPEVHVIVKDNEKSFDLLQKFVEGRILHKSDLVDQKLKDQFVKLIQLNQLMEDKEKISWDFFGAWSLFLGNKDRVGNIVVTPENNLGFIDIGTMRLEKRGQPLLVWLIIKWAARRQRSCLKYLLRQNPNRAVPLKGCCPNSFSEKLREMVVIHFDKKYY
ncbi:hypothetical protein COT49_00455 [candidate division WWE3 bacterium CG08_land_8_20_14_0_20_40_13]|uniref:Aminoglycoside phosphotransferase domain-containing protein n=1 Tax=candidate division WWE3 bacterium CG08_land_8_20_14_0_20_40_13 TaxID=1975084 RepID=A0A2H0XEE2_UNCKA|nr:MAG: hypothetical protein COT49_00455 [candidate division WWE3 bacterium CG08_land_8_20_14_0_20_40_13]